MEYRIKTKTSIDTQNVAEKVGKALFKGALLTLEGDLGAGKTTFTKGIAKALGITKIVNSPTFTIMKIYEADIPLYHLDVYRLEGKDEELGFDEYFNGDGICVIEWAQYIEKELPLERLEIRFNYMNEEEREIIFTPKGEQYEQLCKRVFE